MPKKEHKTWRDKLKEDSSLGRITKIYIPEWMQVEELIRQVPEGKVVTDEQMRNRMARDAGADSTCYKLTGYLIKGISEEAEEAREAGQGEITPWWRVIAKDGSLKTNLPGGVQYQTQLLAAEGHQVVEKGKKHMVVDLESRLVEM
jgi:alkylated DNA nucleotide flippase Atl1